MAERVAYDRQPGLPPRYARPHALPDGRTVTHYVSACVCAVERRRGPKGGCCGACGKAIPQPGEHVW